MGKILNTLPQWFLDLPDSGKKEYVGKYPKGSIAELYGSGSNGLTVISEIDTSLDNHEEQLIECVQNETGKKVRNLDYREVDAGSGYYLEAYNIEFEDEEERKSELFAKWESHIQSEYEYRVGHLDYYLSNYDDAYKGWLSTMDETIHRLLRESPLGEPPLFEGQDKESLRKELELIKEDIAEYFASGEVDLALEYSDNESDDLDSCDGATPSLSPSEYSDFKREFVEDLLKQQSNLIEDFKKQEGISTMEEVRNRVAEMYFSDLPENPTLSDLVKGEDKLLSYKAQTVSFDKTIASIKSEKLKNDLQETVSFLKRFETSFSLGRMSTTEANNISVVAMSWILENQENIKSVGYPKKGNTGFYGLVITPKKGNKVVIHSNGRLENKTKERPRQSWTLFQEDPITVEAISKVVEE